VIAENIFFSYINPYLKGLGVSDSNISFINAIAPIFTMLIIPVMGRVAYMVGRKRVIVWMSLFLIASVFGLLFLNIQFNIFSVVVFFTHFI